MTLHTYIPQDRVRALARGETLPDRTAGAALFADISGFTQLTEALRNALGPRRGAEELSKHLAAVYSVLIAEIERHGGSVLNFAGDSMLCWFDQAGTGEQAPDGGASPARLAAACGLELQHAMDRLGRIALPGNSTTALTLKVAVTSGPARRFVVGDPTIHLFDALAGATIARAAVGEHLTQSGEVVCDAATVAALGAGVVIQAWREEADPPERFAVVTAVPQPAALPPARPVDFDHRAPDELRAWLPQALIDRARAGSGSFLTEFRPCVVLFVRFMGIDYDQDAAGPQLDAFLRRTQAIVDRLGGTLLQLIIGDKGSYAYINFGVLATHEDNTRRAVKTAIELREAAQELGFLEPLQTGITQGSLRVGAYGGPTRQTFGALGDDVNLSARLMQTARPGEILVSGQVHKAVEAHFAFEPRPPLPMKGKAEPLPVFAVTGERKQRAVRLQEPSYSLPMVGRQSELQAIDDRLELALAGQNQVVGIVAEAGMGKSRLVAEVIRLARRKGFAGFGGTCQSDGVNTPYLAWKSIWRAFFGVDPDLPARKQLRLLEGEIEDRAPARTQAMPLLSTVLDLEIPDNDFTRPLEPEYRKSTLHALFADCLRAAAQDEPLLIVVEDLHWVDALSHDLLEELANGLADSPICFVLAYRPPQLTRLLAPRLEALPQFTRIELHELSRAEAEGAIRAKLAQLYPARSGPVPPGLVDKLMARAQGNPFYLEELLNYLRDRGLDPRDPAHLDRIELPDSLHTLVLSRIDQLSERQKTTLRVASIIGRLFRANWLTGYYPALGELAQIKSDLDKLHELEITSLDPSEPELAYLFKHFVLHEVTYETLPFGLRAQLHEQFAAFIENQIEAGALPAAPLLGTLVHHYTHSTNRAKQRAYLKQAGEAALQVSAFHTAVEYLTRLLDLTPEGDPDRASLALPLAEAHFRLGDFNAARDVVHQARAAAQVDTDRAAALSLLGEMTTLSGDFAAAQTLLAEAVPLARASGDQLSLCRALYALGDVNWRLGLLDEARAALDESLALARALNDVTRELFALNRLGVVLTQTDQAESERVLAEVHARAVAAGNRERAMSALNNLGSVTSVLQDYAAAQAYYSQALTFARELDVKQMVALCLINMAETDLKQGQLAAARAKLREGLALALRIGALPNVVAAVSLFAELAHAEGDTGRALALFGLAQRHPAWTSEEKHHLDAALARWALDPAVAEAGQAKGAELDWEATIEALLKG